MPGNVPIAGPFYAMKKSTSRKKQRPSTRISVKALILTLLGLATIYFLFLAGSHNVIRYYRQKSQKETLLKNIDSLKAQKTKLKIESQRLKNDLDYIEKIAREKYNMKKKDEKVYKIIKGK